MGAVLGTGAPGGLDGAHAWVSRLLALAGLPGVPVQWDRAEQARTLPVALSSEPRHSWEQQRGQADLNSVGIWDETVAGGGCRHVDGFLP